MLLSLNRTCAEHAIKPPDSTYAAYNFFTVPLAVTAQLCTIIYIPVQLNCYLLANAAACPCHQNHLSCHVPIVPKSRGSQRLYLLYFDWYQNQNPYTAKTQCRTFETNIPRKGIVRPQSNFPRSCVCELFIYSQDRSAYSAAGYMRTYPGNLKKANGHKNVEIGTEVTQFLKRNT